MTTITFQGKPLHTIGNLPNVGSTAPDFTLTKTDFSEVSLKDLTGHKVILSIFPSLDTPVCSKAIHTFNEKLKNIPNVKIIYISADLPFAAKRFCALENVQNITHASTFSNPDFGKEFGVSIAEGPLKGLMSRAIIALDENNRVLYTEQVAELSDEPNYSAVLSALHLS